MAVDAALPPRLAGGKRVCSPCFLTPTWRGYKLCHHPAHPPLGWGCRSLGGGSSLPKPPEMGLEKAIFNLRRCGPTPHQGGGGLHRGTAQRQCLRRRGKIFDFGNKCREKREMIGGGRATSRPPTVSKVHDQSRRGEGWGGFTAL